MTRLTLLALTTLCVAVQIKGSTLEGLADVGIKIAALAGKSKYCKTESGFSEQQSKRYVRIVNTMGPDVEVTADCASGDDTIKTQKLADGKDFAWMFSPHIFGRTLFWCEVKTSSG